MPESAAPFCAGGTGVGAHDRAIDHHLLHIGIGRERSMHRLPDAFGTPALKTFVDAIPDTKICGQQTPLGAATGNPQHRFEEAPTPPGAAHIHIWMPPKKGVDFRPLIISELVRHFLLRSPENHSYLGYTK